MPAQKGEIQIRAFNPYLRDFPNRSLITRDTLQLIKMLRAAGLTVVVEGLERRKPEYVIRKGVIEFLEQPLVLFLIGIPVQVATALITAWILQQKKWFPHQQRERSRKKGTRSSEAETNIVIETYEDGQILRFNHRGQKMNPSEYRRVLRLFGKVSEGPKTAKRASTVPTNSEFPLPLYLEHTDKVVGRARLDPDPESTRTMAKTEIFDRRTRERIESKELKGFSIAGIVKRSICTICDDDYTKCNHIAGETYDGKECTNRIEKLDLTDVSIVAQPINLAAVIFEKKKPK